MYKMYICPFPPSSIPPLETLQVSRHLLSNQYILTENTEAIARSLTVLEESAEVLRVMEMRIQSRK